MKKLNVPVLPLTNIVFYPGTELHVFIDDANYIAMVEKSVLEQTPVALSLIDRSNQTRAYHRISPSMTCTLGRVQIVEKYKDGSILALFFGLSRIHLHHIIQEAPYLIYETYNVEDIDYHSSGEVDGLERIHNILASWIQDNFENEVERNQVLDNIKTPDQLIYHTCFFLIQGTRTKQLLLEIESRNGRIKILNTLLKGNHPKNEDPDIAKALILFDGLEYEYDIAH